MAWWLQLFEQQARLAQSLKLIAGHSCSIWKQTKLIMNNNAMFSSVGVVVVMHVIFAPWSENAVRSYYEFWRLSICCNLHVALFLLTVAVDGSLRVDWSAASSLSDLALLGNTRTCLARRLILTAPLGALDFSEVLLTLSLLKNKFQLGPVSYSSLVHASCTVIPSTN